MGPAAPGAAGGWVLVNDARKRALPEDAPFPAALAGTAESATDSATDSAAESAAEAPDDKPESEG